MKPKTCQECRKDVVEVERASGGYVQILVAPSEDGRFYRLPHGKDVGKFLKVEGPLLDRMRAEGKHLHGEHTCQPGGLF